MRKKLIFAAVVLLALVAAAFVAGWLRRRGHAEELEKYKADLRQRGEKLTFTELAIPPSTSAADVASKAIFANNKFPDVTSSPVLMNWVAADKARVAWRGSLLLPATNDDATSEFMHGDWNGLRQDSLVTADALKRFADAINHPPPDDGNLYSNAFYTFSYLQNQGSHPYHTVKMICQGLLNESLLNLHDTNLALATKNLCELAGMANIYRNNLEFLNIRSRSSYASEGLAVTWEALQQSGWNDASLAELQRSWTNVDLLEGLERSVAAERILNLLMMERVRKMGAIGFVKSVQFPPVQNRRTLAQIFQVSLYDAASIIYKVGGHDEDELMVLHYWTALVDSVRQIRSGKPVSASLNPVDSLLSQNLNRITSMSGGQRFIDLLALPALTGSIRRILHIEMQRRMTITAIAIKRYQLKHDKVPSSLMALVPDFLDAVPMDVMSGKPLCYKLNADGTFVLYSTGEDGKDDGGDATPRDGGTDYGLWEGRDAVWPTAASPEEEVRWENSLITTNASDGGTR